MTSENFVIQMMGNEGGQARKGFSIIKIKEGDLAKLPPLRIIGITTRGKATVIIVANDSVKGQGGRSVRVKGTNGVGKGPNDELALNSDQHPDPHSRGTGSSTVGLGKIQVRKNLPNSVIWTLIFLFNQLSLHILTFQEIEITSWGYPTLQLVAIGF